MRSPVVLDERYVYAYTVYYALAAIWGLLATRNGLVAIAETAGRGYEAGFTFLLAVLSGVLCMLTTSSAQRVEKWFTLAWCALVSAFPTAVIWQWIVEGDLTRAPGSASTFMYLVFPAARFVYLVFKTRRPRGTVDG